VCLVIFLVNKVGKSRLITKPQKTESEEQITLFEWAGIHKRKYPGLELMFHVPNGGARSKSEGARLKREGVKAGIPDIFLPVPRGRYYGLFIEMKRSGNLSRLSRVQYDILQSLANLGYATFVCQGFEEAKTVIENYYKGGAMCDGENP